MLNLLQIQYYVKLKKCTNLVIKCVVVCFNHESSAILPIVCITLLQSIGALDNYIIQITSYLYISLQNWMVSKIL